MLRFGGGFEPRLSLYLRISEKESRLREAKRYADAKDWDVIQMDLKETPNEPVNEQRFRLMSDWLAEELDYFHIIDASRSKDEVYQDIAEKIAEVI